MTGELTQQELKTLVGHWLAYKEAMATEPYDADRVQAFGMRFAETWRKACRFSYDIKDFVMPILCTRVQMDELESI